MGGVAIRAFSLATLRAQHLCKHLVGCLERGAKPFQPAWPWTPGQHRAAISDSLYTSSVLRAGADACTCVYFHGRAPELSLHSQSKKMLTTTTLSSNCKFLNLRALRTSFSIPHQTINSSTKTVQCLMRHYHPRPSTVLKNKNTF